MSSVGDQLKLQLPSWINMMQIIGFSKDFFELVRDIGEAKSKEEEERIIKNEAQKLKVVMSQPDQSKKMKEYLIRAIYCVMLGHDIPFAYVHALTMTQDPKMINKRTGFLAVSLCLHENHELLLMVVNSIQKGLLSTNYLEVCSALIALCKLINADTIPAFLPTVVNLLSHTKAAVRKKACMAIHRFWLKSPESISHLSDKLRVVLCDRDASVMAASLCLFLDMARVDPTPFKDLIPSFVSILKQVSENRLPRSYEYHQVPAPWIQINLLKLLALLGADDQAASEHMYEVLLQAMQRAEKYKNNAGYAVLYEAIMATTRIRANTALLEAAANSIGQLIRVRNHNLKYLGIQALAAIVRVAPRFVAPHQMEVIECLESTDESIKRKTLDLLYRMTNTKNVVVIVAKLIEYLQNTVATDELVRAELVSRINELAERYAPNNHWYIDTMNVMLQVGGAHVRPEVAYNLIRLISQDNGNSEDEDIQLRHYAVSVFLKSLESGEPLPDMHVQVLSWVVSEYGYLATSDSSISLDGIVARFADLMERPHTDIKTRGWILTGLLKLAAQLDHIPPSILSLIQKYTRSRYPDLMMRAYEFLALIHNPVLMGEALPVDASCEDLEVDPTLSFLNAHANRGIANGTFKPYIPKEMRTTRASTTTSSLLFPVVTPAVVTGSTRKELNFSYPAPPVPSPLVHSGAVSPLLSTPAVSSVSAPLATLQPALDTPSSSQQLKVQNSVWTREGFVGKGISNTINPTTAATPIPVPSLTSNPLVLKPITSTQPQQAKLNEKQASLASQLFSGLAVSSGSASVPAKTTPAPSKPAPKPRNTPQTSKSTSSLFPLPTSTTTTQPSSAYTSVPASPTRTPMPSSAENFLIDLGDLSSAFSSSSLKSSTPLKSSASTSTPASPQTPNAFTPPASSPVPTRPNTHSPILAPSLMDDIPSQLPAVAGAPDTLLSPSAPLASQITPGSSFEVSNLTYTPFMGSIMDGSPTTAYERIGKEDELLQVGCVKVLRAQETLLVFMLSNKSPTCTLSEVTTTVQIPDHFSAELSADPLVRINAKTFSLAALPTSRTVLEVISLKHKKHGYNLAVTSQVQYTWEGRRTNVSDCNVPLEICDFLRPHPITIDLVGNLWALHTHESKAKFTPATSVASSSALLTRLKTDLSVHSVQVIGNEGIAAASLLNGELLLMHVVVAVAAGAAVDVTSTVTVTVRSKDKSFTEVVIRYLHRLLR